MNILKFGYVYKNPIKNIPQVFRNIKYAYQRIVQGYCDADLWDLDYYLAKLLPEMLNGLADTAHGWPQSSEFPEFEDWQNYIREIATHFKNTTEDSDSDIQKESDKCFDLLMEWEIKNSINPFGVNKKTSPEYQQLSHNWLEKEKEVAKFREQEKNKAFDMLKEVFFTLWD